MHKIMAPDYPHLGAETYRSEDPSLLNYDVWFPIQLNGTVGNSSRYVHAGHVSHGCLTVYDIRCWNSVYNYPINRRTPDTKGMYVGRIVVGGEWK